MPSKLPPHFVELLYDTLLKSFWRKKSLRNLDVSATRLREWVEQLDGRVAPTETTTPDFIESTPMPLPTAGECVVEVAEPSGRKVQVALKGSAAARLPEVLRALCGTEVVSS